MSTILWSILAVLGSPYFFWRAWRRSHHTPKRVLIIQWAKLGDLVCTTPMFRALKTTHPDWEIHLLCRTGMQHVVAGNPFLDRVITHNGSRGSLIRLLRTQHYDIVINCLPSAFMSIIGILCSVPMRINTFSYRSGFLVRFLTVFNIVNRPFHLQTRTFDHYLSLLKPLGVSPIPYKLDFFPSAADAAAIKIWLQAKHLEEKRFLCFNVSAGNRIKEWPAASFAELADRMIEKHQLPIVLSTLDVERIADIRRLSRHADKLIDASTLSLGQFGALCTHAAAFIAVDTGPLYIANAMGVPLVVLVGGSDPNQQIPPAGDHVRHVLSPAGSVPWMFVTQSPRTATEEQRKSVTGMTVDAAAAALDSLL